MPLQDAGFLEQADGAVDGGDRDAGIDRRGALVQLLDVGMILGFAEHARDDLALLGDAQALFGAERLDIDAAGHVVTYLDAKRGAAQTGAHEKRRPAEAERRLLAP